MQLFGLAIDFMPFTSHDIPIVMVPGRYPGQAAYVRSLQPCRVSAAERKLR
jgi:hypothetical protein